MDPLHASQVRESRTRALSRGFAILSGLTACLIVVGALVRANDAGLACPDWPLCHDQVVPPFDLKVGFEWGHRVFAGSISLGLLFLSVVARRDSELWPQLRLSLWVAWLVLCTQIVFGGLTVLLLLAPWTVGVHLLLGNAFCLILLWISRELSENATPSRSPIVLPSGTAWGVGLVGIVLFAQLVLGGWVSSHYAGLACTDFPTCDGKEIVPTLEGLVGIHVLHRLNGMLLLASYGLVFARLVGVERAGRIAGFGFGLVVFQVAVGFANVLLRIPIPVTGLHSALATAIVLTTMMLIREVLRAQGAPAEPNADEVVVEVR